MEVFLKLLHIAAVAFWFAGALYLPRLFQQQCRSSDVAEIQTLVAMARRIYFEVMSPGAIVAVVLGTALIFFGFQGGWLPVKLLLVLLLALFHLYCGRILLKLEKKITCHGPLYYNVLTFLPVPLLVAIAALAVAKPF